MSDPRLRLWSVEIATDGRPRYASRHHTINVAAPDIQTAIDGAMIELAERMEAIYEANPKSGEPNPSQWWCISASHKGVVNRIVE